MEKHYHNTIVQWSESPPEFSSQRNIHTKNYIPKAFEGLIVDKSKEMSVSNCSKFLIGGLPSYCSQEHLFPIKNIILPYSKLKIPLYMKSFDIKTYFDKSLLKDGMDKHFRSNMRGKFYRLWYEL